MNRFYLEIFFSVLGSEKFALNKCLVNDPKQLFVMIWMKIKQEKVEQDKEYIGNTAFTLNKREQTNRTSL